MGSFLAATFLLAAALLHGGSASTYESECSPTSFVGGSYSTNSYVILGFQGVPNFYTYQSNFFLSDSTCVTPDLTIRLVGMFTRGADGSYPTVDKNGVSVSTTTTIDTVWTAWSAFAYNDNGAMFLEDQCNITNVMMGENIDLFPTGCALYGLPPHADCPVYYDVLDAHTDYVLLGYDDMTFGVCDSMDRSTVVDNTEVYTILPPMDIATMDYTTGDFGGMAFPMRDEFETYIETDAMGDVVSYGFYMPINSRSGMSALPFTDVSRGAALAFNTSMLAMPEQMPFKFVGINYNPGGHPGLEYLIPHYDIHIWLHPKEYAIGIQCDGAFPPCVTTPYLAEKFGKLPDQKYYPMNYTTDASEYVPTMGAHLIPNPIPNTFDMEPAYIFGSYDGELIYHEPMISNAVFDQIPAGGELVFNWPMVDAYPKPGKYFTKIRLSVEGTAADGRYKIALTDLMDAPETSRGRSVYFGMVEVPSLGQIQNAVSMKKDCVIATDEVVDAGWTVVSGGESYCCRARGMMDQGSCVKSSCGNSKPLTNPVDAYFSDSMDCYASCYMRN